MQLERRRYAIEKCGAADIAEVMAFFGAEHDPCHVLAASRRFVDWQYYDPASQRYNILFARDTGGAVLGLLAYIPNTFFDPSIPPARKFVWTANWLAKKDDKGFVGLDLLYALPQFESCENLGIVGLTAAAAAFYKRTGYRVGQLAQYFFVNENVKRFRVLQGYDPRTTSAVSTARHDTRLLRLDSLTDLNSPLLSAYIHSTEPYKSAVFFENKYMKNPFYRYFAYGLETEDGLAALLIGRKLTHNGVNVVRLVEYVGHERALCGVRLQAILDEHDAEYLDFYCVGISPAVLAEAGFERNTGEHGLVVPNYFEPVQNANIGIEFAYKAPVCCIYKGDGDRDHPRVVEG